MTFIQEKVEEFNPEHNDSVLGRYIIAYENARTAFGSSESANKKADQKINNWLTTTLTEALEEGKRMERESFFNAIDAEIKDMNAQGTVFEEMTDRIKQALTTDNNKHL